MADYRRKSVDSSTRWQSLLFSTAQVRAMQAFGEHTFIQTLLCACLRTLLAGTFTHSIPVMLQENWL